jgi:large subunit ribosomal protein L2
MNQTQSSRKILTKKKPEKKLLLSLKNKAGRGRSGRITVRHRGGGAKRLYRLIDFGQEKLEIPGKVVALEYDPNRTAYIALIEYGDGDRRDKSQRAPRPTNAGISEKRYILAPKDLKVGDEIICQEAAEIKTGNRIKLMNIPVGAQVYNIELESGKGGKIVKAAGTSAKVIAQEPPYTHLELPSKEIRKIPQQCFASIGQVSHSEKRFEKIGKAGRKRLKGWRPTVRGTAMIPPDHPHGGGEGRSPIGLKHPKTPWGKPAKGVKTRRKKWTEKLIIKQRKHR